MSSRPSVISALLALGLVPVGISAEAGPGAFAPESFGVHRYQGIWKRSPFIVETVVKPVTAGLSAKYSLVGIASLGNQPVVFLVDKTNGDTTKNRLLVSKAKPGPEGVELVSVILEPDARKSSAVIRQGGQQATLVFDPMSLGPQAASVQPGTVPPSPTGMAGMPGGGLIPPPAMVPGNLPSANPGAPPAPSSPRRIIRPAPINLTN